MSTSFEKINKEEFEKLQKELKEQVLLNKKIQSELESKTKEFNFLQNKVNRVQKSE